jgi:hypothetical protein
MPPKKKEQPVAVMPGFLKDMILYYLERNRAKMVSFLVKKMRIDAEKANMFIEAIAAVL